MKYTKPELEWIRFENGDILTESDELPIDPAQEGEVVEEIVGGQLPLGIFQDLEPQKHYLRLEEGDSVILMTDGVLEAFRDRGYEEAARSCLAGMKDLSPKEMAEKLMQFAIFASEGNVRDDMTILVATLWRNP